MQLEKSLWLKKYFQFTNYISASMLYLKENFLLQEPLIQEHIKDRILGHWGTVPGLNLIYGGLNILIKEKKINTTLVIGPGHGAPAILSGLFLEGTLEQYYPEYSRDVKGLNNLIRKFSWPGGFPSHTSPILPGNLHEGGELGYSLSTAFGVAFDNPENLVVCIIGDGEAETGTLSASWHSNKFINPSKDGIVLPILHLNGYKISGPSIFATMSKEEIKNYFNGLGYYPIFIDQYESNDNIFQDFITGLFLSWEKITKIKNSWSNYEIEKPNNLPVIVLKTKKGWTGPKFNKEEKIEDNHLSHGIPLLNPKKNDQEFQILKEWLESYNVKEFINENGYLISDLYEYIPKEEFRIGNSKLVNKQYETLKLPNPENESIKVIKKGERPEKRMEYLAEFLRDIFLENYPVNNFRIFSPDETESNVLSVLFTATDRIYTWTLRKHDKYFSDEGNIMEILSENVLQGWLTGYLLSGRHGILISYEAFLNVISSQIDQFIKFLNHSEKVFWRNKIPSLNLVATSTLWRQEHNGFTHQNPTLINSLLTKYNKNVKIYFPSDVNTMLVTLYKCLNSTNGVNLIIVGKRDMPQYFTYTEAQKHVEEGISELEWINNLTKHTDTPDVILVSIGDYQTNECIQGIKLVNEFVKNAKIRFLNINEISQYSIGNKANLLENKQNFEKYFTKDIDVIINFHGYPTAIKQLLFNFKSNNRFKILGYQEKGTTTTPLDMQILNGTSRFHVAIEIIESISKNGIVTNEEKEKYIKSIQKMIDENNKFIVENGIDKYPLY